MLGPKRYGEIDRLTREQRLEQAVGMLVAAIVADDYMLAAESKEELTALLPEDLRFKVLRK